MRVPSRRRARGHARVERHALDQQVLEIPGAWIGGPAQQDRAAVGAGQKRQHRVLAHVGIHRHRIRAVAIERLAGIGLGRVADVVALGVEDDQRLGCALADVLDARREFVFLAERAVERDLRLVGRGHARVSHRRCAGRRPERAWGRSLRSGGSLDEVGIQPDAHQAVRGDAGSIQAFGERERHVAMIAGALGVCLSAMSSVLSAKPRGGQRLVLQPARPPCRAAYQSKHPEAVLRDRRRLGAFAVAAMPAAQDSLAPGARALPARPGAAPLGGAAGAGRPDRQHPSLPVRCGGQHGSGLGISAHAAEQCRRSTATARFTLCWRTGLPALREVARLLVRESEPR